MDGGCEGSEKKSTHAKACWKKMKKILSCKEKKLGKTKFNAENKEKKLCFVVDDVCFFWGSLLLVCVLKKKIKTGKKEIKTRRLRI